MLHTIPFHSTHNFPGRLRPRRWNEIRREIISCFFRFRKASLIVSSTITSTTIFKLITTSITTNQPQLHQKNTINDSTPTALPSKPYCTHGRRIGLKINRQCCQNIREVKIDLLSNISKRGSCHFFGFSDFIDLFLLKGLRSCDMNVISIICFTINQYMNHWYWF